MKLKLLILFFSFLLIPIETSEIFDTQLSEYFTFEVEEEPHAEFSQFIFDYILIEDGGCFGDGILVDEHNDDVQPEVPTTLKIYKLSKYNISYKIPRYIRYCRLKIA